MGMAKGARGGRSVREVALGIMPAATSPWWPAALGSTARAASFTCAVVTARIRAGQYSTSSIGSPKRQRSAQRPVRRPQPVQREQHPRRLLPDRPRGLGIGHAVIQHALDLGQHRGLQRRRRGRRPQRGAEGELRRPRRLAVVAGVAADREAAFDQRLMQPRAGAAAQDVGQDVQRVGMSRLAPGQRGCGDGAIVDRLARRPFLHLDPRLRRRRPAPPRRARAVKGRAGTSP